ncbi:unnamed protein product [Rotaria socialis]|uniref:RING-type domain-containing protein n=1 Tax=Rotaria socialis TaxID=392032 RepID=A0A821VHC6_9BILA|nr:unnamed protein product [Rotaria socialis]CAF4906093.1 unnamed protein product [Rotaria socialis]
MSQCMVDKPNSWNSRSDPTKQLSRQFYNNRRPLLSSPINAFHKAITLCSKIRNSPGVHSIHLMEACGFIYTGTGDTARCSACGLEKDNWTSDRYPLTVHLAERPDCPFIVSLKCSKPATHAPSPSPSSSSSSSSFSTHHYSCSSPSAATIRSTSISNEQEYPSKRLKIEITDATFSAAGLFETDRIQEVRKRTFSHWPHRNGPSQLQMIEAGFFNCNVGDRVICIYCNLICQQWTPNVDDPCEVHKTLSPKCIYVRAKLLISETRPLLIVNETVVGATVGNPSSTANNDQQLRYNEFVPTAACNTAYAELPKRTASFLSWPNENLPPVDQLVRAGFFYTGTKTIVTCFYCNGSLQNWGSNDNPTIEHARWFPHCAYAKQLCGAELYRKIQESKRAQQERTKANGSRETASSSGLMGAAVTSNSQRLLIPDESTLSRLVAARLDLPISQRLLDKQFKLSIIKRCWEDQLRLKHDDFVTDSDLHTACMILQKQIAHIDGKKENIVVPSIRMKTIREDAERAIAAATSGQQAIMVSNASVPTQSSSTISPSVPDVEMTTELEPPENVLTTPNEYSSPATVTSSQDKTRVTKSTTLNDTEKHQTREAVPVNPCVLCSKEEKRLACIPCGHLAACVSCSQSLRSCPICRREIEAFVKIYV